MNKISTLLIEDEGAALRRLNKFATNNPFLEVINTVKTGKKAVESINNLNPELILLDIELKDMTAFDVLSNLKAPFKGQIIFTTAYNKYAVKAFNISATDYLLKPYDENRFNEAIEKAKQQQYKTDINTLLKLLHKTQTKSNEEKLILVEGTKTHYLLPNTIILIKADGYYCKIFKIEKTTMLIRKTLKEIHHILPKETFSRVNRSTIINKNYIEKEVRNITQHFFYLKGGFKIKKSTKY
ncbi:LytR/AlgR family response regulator transcription factor [Ichthyenterobacterium magnum]|uniref:LytTR family two component transcriptional regulator n=1 Tax=Ichthyenterobacterium magnum TaxID=1230530 RepID=A0A420DEG4_9FLAO|nr:LytTR family DNA-binding domain-containing protein [Ichthyenterobacterium magnum]RKE90798.1 LytTR family two component transcriptional regulator [Ichthyenterobacterium magnum]